MCSLGLMMDSRVLIALLLASVHMFSCGASEPSPNFTCPKITSTIETAVRNNHSITLSCKIKSGVPIPILLSSRATILWHYRNSTGYTVWITNNTGLGKGINFTLQDHHSGKNVLLNISLPRDHSRIGAEMNYTCGCAGYNATAVQTLIGQ